MVKLYEKEHQWILHVHKFIKNQSLVNNIYKSQTRSETRNVYMGTNLE